MTPLSNEHAFYFLHALAERSSQVVFAYDTATTQFVYLNPSFEQVWHISREHALANPASLRATIHPEDKVYLTQTYHELVAGNTPEMAEFRIRLPDQSERWIKLTPFVVAQESGEPVIAGYAEDVTDRRMYIDNLKKYTSKKNAMLEILAHDLAGPLATIQGLSTLLATRVKAYQDIQLDELIGLITESSKRNIQLIREFLRQEFLESTTVDVITRRVNLVEKLGEVIEEYRNFQESRSKHIQFFTSNDPVYVFVDDVKMMQVVNNLLSNALKFTPDDGTITVRVEEQDTRILITVADNGIGIPAHLQADLFDKFTKARRPGLKGEPTTGLGMSICKLIVEWHKGNIWFESQENKGTTFYIELPKTE